MQLRNHCHCLHMGELGHSNSPGHVSYTNTLLVKSRVEGEKKTDRIESLPQRNMKQERYFSDQKETPLGFVGGTVKWGTYQV